MISRRFIEAVKLADEPAYRIAWRAGLHPATLSKILTGAERVREGDRRVLAVAEVLGLSRAECFEPERDNRPGVSGKGTSVNVVAETPLPPGQTSEKPLPTSDTRTDDHARGSG